MADRALRILFLHRDGDISIQIATVINKRAPASTGADNAEPGSGFWLELRDGKKVVYRRLVSAQFEKDVEVFGGGSEEPFARVALSVPSEIELLVPLPANRDESNLRLVLLERRARAAHPSATSAARGDKHDGADRPTEKQYVEVTLSELVAMHQGEK